MMTRIDFKALAKCLVVLALLGGLSSGSWGQIKSLCESRQGLGQNNRRLDRFTKQLEDLRQSLKIPGLSAAIVRDQKVVWAKGLGFADIEKRIPATPDTPYRIASLTKTFASTLLMQLVEQGKLDLDEPMSKYSSGFKNDAVKVRHVFTHTSEGTPGDRYHYSGNRFASLTTVIEKVSDRRFRELLANNILDKLDMTNSVPGQNILAETGRWSDSLSKETLNRYEGVLARLANPYILYGSNEMIPVSYPPLGISASAGLISTVIDLAKYDAAVDRHVLLKQETQERVFTPAVSNDGRTLPYGLGWFIQQHAGLRLIWHYGYWPQFSALILKVPEKSITFILLANSDGLSAPFGLGAGDVMRSPFACTFFRLFVVEDSTRRPLSDPRWSQNVEEFSAELSRFEGQADGYTYECEVAAHTAVTKWLKRKRESARTAVKVDPKIYDAYLGQYAYAILTVTREGDRVFAQLRGQQKFEIFPKSETEFFWKVVDAQVTFVKNEAGVVVKAIHRQHGEFEAPKIK
ncbi:MAG: serine hydrolase [candidate division Zixibacteria bacterium]|nr:serine hydrolase [candidate division Zixibacteria bacterium]